MIDVSEMLWGMLFGTAGFSYFMYGKKQGRLVALLCGLLLMVFPYFIANEIAVIIIGFILCGLPYYFRF